MHHTNILSCGTQPYMIDLETVFYPVASEMADSDRLYIQHSVLQSMLMPFGDDKYIPAAGEALNYELEIYRQYSGKFGTWADMRDFSPKKYMHGYCYGAPGIGIMLHRIGRAGGELAETLRGCARKSIDELPLGVVDQLCCANGAVVEYYLTTGDYDSAGDVLAAMYERRQKEGCYMYHSYGQNSAVTASLFYGLL